MEIEPHRKAPTFSFAVVLVFLLVMAGGLVAVFVLTMRQAQVTTDDMTVRFLVRLAWVSVALLGLTVVMLFWAILHFIIRRIGSIRHPPTEYVNAWSLAGQRAKPIEEDDDEINGEQPDKPGQ